MLNIKKEYKGLDYFRVVAAILVIAIHIGPFVSINENFDYIITGIVARIAVPFFLMVTGFFVVPKLSSSSSIKNKSVLYNYVKKITKLYLISILIYLPINIYGNNFVDYSIYEFIKDIIFDGTFYHLWYFPALILALPLIYFLVHKFNNRKTFLVVLVLYMFGLLGDSYFGITNKVNLLSDLYSLLFKIFDYTRNGIFFAPIFITMGGLIACSNKKYSFNKMFLGFILSLLLMIIEGIFVKENLTPRHNSMYIMLVPCMYFLFNLLACVKGEAYKILRVQCTIVYIIHPFCLVVLRAFAKLFKLKSILIGNSIICFSLVVIMSFAVARAVQKIFRKTGCERGATN